MLLLFLLDQHSTKEQIMEAVNSEHQASPGVNRAEMIQLLAISKKYNQAPFYLTVHNRGWSSEFYENTNPSIRELLDKLSFLTLDADATKNICNMFLSVEDQFKYSELNSGVAWKAEFNQYSRTGDLKKLWRTISESNADQHRFEEIHNLIVAVQSAEKEKSLFDAFPSLSWHGTTNRFHHFMSNYLWSNRRQSIIDGRTVYAKVLPALGITLFINIISLIVLLLLGIPLGMRLFSQKNRIAKQFSRMVLYVLYALPLFWIATMILISAGWFPWLRLTGTPHLLSNEVPSILTFLRPGNWVYLLLPVISIVLSLLAVIAIQMERAMKDVNNQKFILAAKTKGLKEDIINKKHNRPVALYSIITLIGNSIPGLISGSIVVEIIFNIPGMGRLLWHSLYAYDWNVVNGILILGVIFSVAGQLLTDLTYYYINPALRTTK